MKRALVSGTKSAAMIAAAAVTLTGCGAYGYGLGGLPLPGGPSAGRDSYRVTADFADVSELLPHSPVMVNDVTVGAVEKIERSGWHAKVVLSLPRSLQLPANAVAAVRETNLVGEKFVALSAPLDEPAQGTLRDGAVIPLSRTTSAVEPEQLLSAAGLLVTGGGFGQLKSITTALNTALDGREDRVRSVLAQLDTFMGGLDAQKADITRVIDNVDRVAAAVNAQRQALTDTVDSLAPVVRTLHDQRAQLMTLLRSLSSLGQVANRVLTASQNDLLALLRDLQPILTRVNAAGDSLSQLLQAVNPVLNNLLGVVKGDYINADLLVDLNAATLLQTFVTGSYVVSPGLGSGGPGPVPPRGAPTVASSQPVPRAARAPLVSQGAAGPAGRQSGSSSGVEALLSRGWR